MSLGVFDSIVMLCGKFNIIRCIKLMEYRVNEVRVIIAKSEYWTLINYTCNRVDCCQFYISKSDRPLSCNEFPSFIYQYEASSAISKLIACYQFPYRYLLQPSSVFFRNNRRLERTAYSVGLDTLSKKAPLVWP